MNRMAHCCCGSLRAAALAEPAVVLACHCTQCQRRTGAPFGVSAFFSREHIRAEGPSNVYIRDGQEGRKVRFHFCPNCGTSVYWEADLAPDMIGVALGAFSDPLFPRPTRSIWEMTRHRWVDFGHELEHSPQGPRAQSARS